jgi:hypothetical protein
MERRNDSGTLASRKLSSPLPADYLKMVTDVFTTNFDAGLQALHGLRADPRFEAGGAIYPDEVVLSVSLVHPGRLAATTVHASVDFDPKASAPKVDEVLAACVDAVGALYESLLNPKAPERLQQLAEESLSALEGIPFEWTAFEIDRFRVHLKVDKSNPKLDEMTDDWLLKNDPEALEREREDFAKTAGRFVTGDRVKQGAEPPPSDPDSDLDEAEEDDTDGSGGGRSGMTH